MARDVDDVAYWSHVLGGVVAVFAVVVPFIVSAVGGTDWVVSKLVSLDDFGGSVWSELTAYLSAVVDCVVPAVCYRDVLSAASDTFSSPEMGVEVETDGIVAALVLVFA